MKAGELFIDIGIKGDKKAIDSLSKVKNWLTDVSASGLAAKASILAAFYAMEKMLVASGKFGNDLKNLSTYTGIDTTKIQQWSEYMRHGGAAAEDAYAALLGAQKVSTAIQLGQVPTLAFSKVAQTTHKNLGLMLNDPIAFANTVKQYFQTTKDAIGIQNEVGSQLQLTPNAISAFRRNKEDIYGIKSNIVSPGGIENLSKVQRAMSDLNKNIETAYNTFNAKHGIQLATDLNHVVSSLLKLADALARLSENLHALDILSAIISTVTGVANEGAGYVSDLSKGNLTGAAKHLWEIWNTPGKLAGSAADWVIKKVKEKNSNAAGYVGGSAGFLSGVPDLKKFNFAPPGKPTSQNTNINVYQNGIEDTHDSVADFKSDISRAWASISTRDMVA